MFILILLLLLCSPLEAGINFGTASSASSATEVVESGVGILSYGGDYYAKLYWCTAIVVPGKYLIHVFPIGHINEKKSKLEYLLKLFFRISNNEKVYVITSHKKGQYHEEVIRLDDIVEVLKIMTNNIEIYDDSEEDKIVFANKDEFYVRSMTNGAGFYCSSIPVIANAFEVYNEKRFEL